MIDTDLSPAPALSFNDLVRKGGYDLRNVRFLRHQEATAQKGRTLYELWRDDKAEFDRYGALHRTQAHNSLQNANYWATFVGLPSVEALFTGFYKAEYLGLSTVEYVSPTTGEISPAGSLHQYQIERLPFLADFEGRIVIKWGDSVQSARTYFQLASGKEKPILEIRRKVTEPDFPGFENFVQPLSKILSLPPTWIAVLKATKGIYVLTCPKTSEMYIGQAGGDNGFFSRWEQYALTGHGENVQLKSREASDYQVAILEVAGTNSNLYEMESTWKLKFQTREKGFGLNRN
jgi:GIY-YIG catalytic domain